MKLLSTTLFAFILILSFSSCKKEVPPAVIGSTTVKIIFLTPTHLQTFSNNEEVSIEARIEANAMMAGYRLTVTNIETGEVIEKFDDIYKETMFIVHHHWNLSMSSPTALEIKLEALDQNMLTLNEKSIQIVCQP